MSSDQPQPPSSPAPGGYPPAPAGYPAAPPPPADPAYGVPQPAAPYRPPQDPRYASMIQPPAEQPSKTLGTVALVLAVVALVVPSIMIGFTAFAASESLAASDLRLETADVFELEYAVMAALSPVRGLVLAGEIAFWAGTAVGIWAIVQGIWAIAKRRGRGAGIAAVVVAALAPLAVGVAVVIGLMSGAFAAVGSL